MSRLTKADKQVLAQVACDTGKVVAIADEQTKNDAFYLMWALQRMGEPRPNVPFLGECCGRLKQCMTQKTAGQPEYAKKDDVRFETELDQLLNFIAIEALALWRSGKLGELKEPEDNGEPFKSDYHDMWDFLKPGNTKSNVPALIELCETLDGMMARNNAGQPMYEAGQKMTIDDVINAIIVEAMCLWLSGGLNKLKDMEDEQ